MKIYNEIVIDMNPESSSYGETLHEDSFNYNGDMMLLQVAGDRMTLNEGRKQEYIYNGKRYTERSQLPKDAQPGQQYWMSVTKIIMNPVYVMNDAGTWEATGEFNEGELPMHRNALGDAPGGPVAGMEGVTEVDPTTGEETAFEFTTTGPGGEFDPTSAEFKTYVEQTGGFEGLATGFGMEEGDFEEFYGKPLDFMKEEYGEEGTLAQGRALDLSTAKEGMRAATATQRIGQEAAGLKAGQSLTDIYTATSAQQEKGGFGPGGATSAISSRATRGVMGDYNLQQKQLAEGMTQAKTAFDISTDRIDLAETQADIDYRRDQSKFWKAEEDKFYDRLMYLESQG